jgi:hypothetical protein
MRQLSPDGQRIAHDLANRHGFSVDAVAHMLFAVLNGNGGMAQFSHPEFGGSGQWMRGGMIMLGDMFNNYLKGRVDNLCSEIANLLANQPGLLQSGSFQSQSQGGGNQQHQATGAMGTSSLFAPDPEDNWWPRDLGAPSATGSQNNVRYAYFANQNRLAVKTGGEVWVYDTQDHRIGGFSQQQGMGGTITFSSQFGTVDLSRLPVTFRNGQPVLQQPTPPPPQVAPSQYGYNSSTNSANTNSANTNSAYTNSAYTNSAYTPMPPANSGEILIALEKLGELQSKGVLTEQEFAVKKAELLSRL